MKNLRKLSRENLKTVKGGITEECARGQAASTACFTTLAACETASPPDPDFGFSFCIRYCNRYCY
ncbi:bacteriocin-like protein [Chryseobacterium sp. SIMBA_038]|uniref:bacteriocin-like protein n=1 Tax=Chryseobacterium sp. SIMBA_038 TaxID=3085780 RepID=UPI00397A66DA